jgi:uncharacterized protein YndB with AHSA1/START domain
VVASVRIEAPPEVVFPYFTDAGLITEWLAKAAVLEARPGGTFSVDIRDGDAKARGTFVEVDPPHRVVFTWGVPEEPTLPPGSSTVEVVLEADGDGTVVTLTHRGLSDRWAESHLEGWTRFVGALGDVVGAG